MIEWKQELGNFFKDRGINDKAHEFNVSETQEIQKFIQEKVKPAYEKIVEELNRYASVNANIIEATMSTDSIQERIGLRIDWIMQPKFIYHIRFAKSEEVLIAIGQYSIPNLYGDATVFKNSDLRNSFVLLEEKDIILDFLKTFKSNTDIR